MPKNTLVQYKGGGFDGCFWEWNYCWFDSKGKFHDIFSSGYKGCKNATELKNKNPDQYRYNFDNQEKVQEFIRESADHHVLMVAKWLYANFSKYADNMIVTCDSCGEEFPSSQAKHSGYEGAGGLAIAYTGFVCESCQKEEECYEQGDVEPVIMIMKKV